jgi:hypothetical protein
MIVQAFHIKDLYENKGKISCAVLWRINNTFITGGKFI